MVELIALWLVLSVSFLIGWICGAGQRHRLPSGPPIGPEGSRDRRSGRP